MKRFTQLKDHKYKKGIIYTPINTIPNLQYVSWKDDRLPEYIWLGLILMNFERTDGILKIKRILEKISQINKNIIKPSLSIILSLSKQEQEKIYNIICEEIDPKILSPLTVICRNSQYPVFNEFFNFPEITIEERIEVLREAIKLYYDSHSFESTDLRFVVVLMMFFQNKLRVSKKIRIPKILSNYPFIKHSEEVMKEYRPIIRTLEMVEIEKVLNKDFAEFFWREIGLKTSCNPMVIEFKEEEDMDYYAEYILSLQDKLRYILNKYKEKSITKDDKFDVIMGLTTYALKIFNEVIEKKLSNCILGRHAFRTILETYIIIKYMLKVEKNYPEIWESYKMYGIGKYKHSLLKERESSHHFDSHFIIPVIEAIVNEEYSEEFINMDVRYFDKKSIKEKFEEVDEKYLYEVFYEYDNNFVHGLWGAVRESSMLFCNNASHRYHIVPDVDFNQNLSPVIDDIYKIVTSIEKIVDEVFLL